MEDKSVAQNGRDETLARAIADLPPVMKVVLTERQGRLLLGRGFAGQKLVAFGSLAFILVMVLFIFAVSIKVLLPLALVLVLLVTFLGRPQRTVVDRVRATATRPGVGGYRVDLKTVSAVTIERRNQHGPEQVVGWRAAIYLGRIDEGRRVFDNDVIADGVSDPEAMARIKAFAAALAAWLNLPLADVSPLAVRHGLAAASDVAVGLSAGDVADLVDAVGVVGAAGEVVGAVIEVVAVVGDLVD